MPAIVAYLMQISMALPQLMAAGKDVWAFWKKHTDKVEVMVAEDRNPTSEEWSELNATIDELREQLHSDDD